MTEKYGNVSELNSEHVMSSILSTPKFSCSHNKSDSEQLMSFPLMHILAATNTDCFIKKTLIWIQCVLEDGAG